MTLNELQQQLGQTYGPTGELSGETPWGSTGQAQTGIAQNWIDMFGLGDAFGGYSDTGEWQEGASGLGPGDVGQMINPVTYKELFGARYGAMRPGVEKGISSLTGELISNLGRIKSGGFESSGYVDRRKQAARDIFGKKASDVLLSEATKRSDYMGSLLDRATAEKELFSSWLDI